MATTTLDIVQCSDLDAALAAPGAKDCNGAAINLTTASLATCANVDSKIAAAIAAIDVCALLAGKLSASCVNGVVTVKCGAATLFAFNVCEATTPTPSMTLVKTGVYDPATKKITYTFTVTNTGQTAISGVAITDPALGLTGLAVSPATLAAGATGTATYVYTPTAAQIAAGKVDNQATASGTDSNGVAVTAPSSPTAGGATGPTTTPIPAQVCTSTGVIAGTASGPFSAGPCTNQPTLGALESCLETLGYTVTLTPGASALAPSAPEAMTIGSVSSVAGTQTTATATGTASNNANLGIAMNVIADDITTLTGGAGALSSRVNSNSSGSMTIDYALTNNGSNPLALTMAFDPRTAGTAVETNMTSFTLTYDTSKFDVTINDPSDHVNSLADGAPVVSGTTYAHDNIIGSAISFNITPKPGVYLAPGETANLVWKQDWTGGSQTFEDQRLTIEAQSLLTPNTITISGSTLVSTVTDGSGATTALSGNCV